MGVGRKVMVLGLLALGLAVAAIPAAAEVTVPVMVFSHDYDPVAKAPTDTVSVVTADVARVVCFTRVQGAAEPTVLTHVWYHEGRTMAKVDLDIRSPDYRTYSSKNLLPSWTGQWEVKVLDADGAVIASAGFVVTGDVGEAPDEASDETVPE